MRSEFIIGNIAKLSYGKMPKKNILNTGEYPTYSGYKYQHTYPEMNCKRDDIIVVARGVGGTGDVKIVKEDCYLTNLSIKIDLDVGVIDKKYFYYNYLPTTLRYLDSGSAQSQITINDLSKLIISVPELQIQKKIAHILSTLDDKIELNRKMNETLEAMAQALFKSWFVDFDPVHARATCRSEADLEAAATKLGIPKEVLELFPSEFVESEMGMIPLGWELSLIGDKLNVLLGGTPSRKNNSYWENGTVAWINSGKVNEFRIIEASEMITEEAVSKSSTKLLPKKTTVLAITGATLGQVSLLEIDSCANQSVIGLPETDELNHSFIYPCICHAIKELMSHQTGGAQQHINKGNVEDYAILIPNEIILEKYVSIVKPLMNTISNNSFEIKVLQKTRDTLLPKLLSGEIDVSNLHIGEGHE